MLRAGGVFGTLIMFFIVVAEGSTSSQTLIGRLREGNFTHLLLQRFRVQHDKLFVSTEWPPETLKAKEQVSGMRTEVLDSLVTALFEYIQAHKHFQLRMISFLL